MKPVIRFQNVSKRYYLGSRRAYAHYLLPGFLQRSLDGRRPAAHGNSLSSREIWALKGVSFEVQPGEALGIIGPNGAGKTTILKLISKITSPTSGRVTVKGRLASLIELGAGFHPDLTGRENILLNGVMLGLTRREIERKLESIVAFSGLQQFFIDTPIKRYSSGMCARLGFSVAAHVDPEILLVDEVLAVGDASFRYRCFELMRALVAQGKTIVFVSHNLDAIQHLCDRVIWLDQGRMCLGGEPTEVLRAYLDDLDNRRVTDNGQRILSSEGSLSIEKVIFRKSDGQETVEFLPGDDVVVELCYAAKERILHPYFSVGVGDGRIGNLFLATMLIDGQVPSCIHGRGVIRCRFKSVPLMPRTYQLWGSVRGDLRYGDLVKWQILGTFRVVEHLDGVVQMGDEASVSHIRTDAPVYIPYSWEFDPLGREEDSCQ